MDHEIISRCANEYCALWVGKERGFADGLSSSSRVDQLAALNLSARYFRVARNFPRQADEGRGAERLGPMLDILNAHRGALATTDQVFSAVNTVRRSAAAAYGKNDLLSAATKFLWLIHRHPVIIFDGNVRSALRAPPGDYGLYTQLWEAKYSELGPMIQEAATKIRHPDAPANEEWFQRRVAGHLPLDHREAVRIMTPEPDLLGAAKALERFAGEGLTDRIAALEDAFVGSRIADVDSLLAESEVSHDLLAAAQILKRAAGQIHVVIHTVGILLCLPRLLEPDERVESLSLGAGNTGRAFDLETTARVAEFKFIDWQGGSESIRQNALFKDFYLLAEHDTTKRKYMYVIDTEHPLRFLRGGRSLDSVMSRNRRLWTEFHDKYGDRFATVGEYFSHAKDKVTLVDVGAMLGRLSAAFSEVSTNG